MKRKRKKQTLLECLEVWLHRLPGFADLIMKQYFDFGIIEELIHVKVLKCYTTKMEDYLL